MALYVLNLANFNPSYGIKISKMYQPDLLIKVWDTAFYFSWRFLTMTFFLKIHWIFVLQSRAKLKLSRSIAAERLKRLSRWSDCQLPASRWWKTADLRALIQTNKNKVFWKLCGGGMYPPYHPLATGLTLPLCVWFLNFGFHRF